MKKILLSLATLSLAAAVAVGATVSYFSDTETSAGNTLVAGSIDLSVGNDSYYNGAINAGTDWSITADLGDGSGPGPSGAYLYLNFTDLKPGDWGEDTINLRVDSNDAWACNTTTLDTSDEEDLTEPEDDMGDTQPAGELAGQVNFIWWADDGDNVYEDNEQLLPSGTLGSLGVGGSAVTAIADSASSIFAPADLNPNGALVGSQTYRIGKAWCFGTFSLSPVPAGQGVDPTVNPGFTCDGSLVDNSSQTDSMTATIEFSAVQERNNLSYTCQ